MGAICGIGLRIEAMEIQRLRHLTTGRLHTKEEHVCEDLGIIIGAMFLNHMIPRGIRAIEPWLREHVIEPRFWNDEHDPMHIGELELPMPSEAERKLMLERYAAQPNPFEGKEIIAIGISKK
jgi:hypothetical protein